MTLDAPAIAAMIDHAILKPELTRVQVDADLAMAMRHRVFSVCVRPSDVDHAVSTLAGSRVAVGTGTEFLRWSHGLPTVVRSNDLRASGSG